MSRPRLRPAAGLLCACCLTLMLAGCSSLGHHAEPIVVDFECDASIQYKDMEMEAHITRAKQGIMCLELTSPDTLAGLKMDWDGKDLYVTLNKVRFPLAEDSLPCSGLGKSLLNVLDTAVKEQGKVAEKDGEMVMTGNGDNGEYTISYDPDNGQLKSIAVPKLNLIVMIKNFSKA